MSLVQIDLTRPRRDSPAPSAPLADAVDGAQERGGARLFALAGGLVLLAPLAPLVRTSPAAGALLLAGLVVLGLVHFHASRGADDAG